MDDIEDGNDDIVELDPPPAATQRLGLSDDLFVHHVKSEEL